MRPRYALALLALLPTGAQAASVDLAGSATVGALRREVTLRVACEEKTRAVSLDLIVPGFADLEPVFDFSGLEGPGGSTAMLSEFRVVGAGGVRTARTRATGAVAAEPATSFRLTVEPARRGETPANGIAVALVEPGARLVWTQASPRKDDAPLVASVTVPAAETGQLRAALTPCLSGP